MTRAPRLEFPEGRRFAFSIMDDTDGATLANVAPVYELLSQLGFRTTKTVWPCACPEGSRDYAGSETLEDAEYLEFVRELQRQGFEIAFHNATMETSDRSRTEVALRRFREEFGDELKVHANHAYNRENLYWGVDRLDDPLLRALYGRILGVPRDHFQGHVPGSPWWWGDLCRERVSYVRNLTFDEINLLRVNPSMPYHDSRRPEVPFWFSAADADDCAEFVRLLRSENQERLEAEGGVCIVATHLGKKFVRDGQVDHRVRRALTELSRRPGWFAPVGTLLDWLRQRRAGDYEIPPAEWRRMQWRWARDLVAQRLRWRMRRAIRAAALDKWRDAASR